VTSRPPEPSGRGGTAPYVIASCAISVDGRIDDPAGERLVLSDAADLDRVDAIRAGCDAILVGAGTVRRDDPRLLVRSPERRARRAERGLPASPARVVLAASGDLPVSAAVFAVPGAPTLVYCSDGALPAARDRLGATATVVGAGEQPTPEGVLDDLAARGMRRVLVEGGTGVHSAFLAAGLVDELHLAVAPFFVGSPGAPPFVRPGTFPHGSGNRMTLAETWPVGDMVVARYLLDGPAFAPGPVPASGSVPVPGGGGGTAVDRRWLRAAVELSRRCPPSASAFSVGAILVGPDGRALAAGFSREHDPRDHAEEAALSGLTAPSPTLAASTLYSTLEPCSARASRPRTCTDLILAAGIGRVVFAWREPDLFVDCVGAETLRAAGVGVVEMPDLAAQVRAVNAHLL
jgi:riboflavin-specific deaminase-like protein